MITGDYIGAFSEGVRDGHGYLKWSNGDVYEGDFKNGLRHGRGALKELNGEMEYNGHFSMSQVDR